MRMSHCKWLLAAGLVAGAAVVYQSRSELQQWFRRHQVRYDGFEHVPASETYVLETNRWLEFDIPNDAPLARLVSNGSISSTVPALPEFSPLGGSAVGPTPSAASSMAAAGLWISYSWHLVQVFRLTSNEWLCWALPMPAGVSVSVMWQSVQVSPSSA